MTIVTADLYDAHHSKLNVCELQFRSYGRRKSFFGECVTLKAFEDHSPILSAVQGEGRGRILVVDGGGSTRVGMMGDRVAEIAIQNGWAGAVIFGAIRDSGGIDELDFGVKALGATARRSWLKSEGFSGIPLGFGSVTFETGMWVYADADSVLVSRVKLDISLASGGAPE
jgi:regulator of ribonuclease activity A